MALPHPRLWVQVPSLLKNGVGDRIVLEKNLNYWKQGLPKSNQLVMRFITDPAARLAQLRAGTIDFTVDLSPDQLKEIQSDANLEAVFALPSMSATWL
jgi:peptide/nickel transport system substrate-binding protein